MFFDFNEPLLEPVVRYLRFKKAYGEIDRNKLITLVDIGCGPEIRFKYFLEKNKIKLKKYIGIDPLINQKIIKKYKDDKKIKLIKSSLNKKIPLPSNIADYVVALAFVEHVTYPDFLLKEIIRILKKGGKAIVTTPSPKAKILLEWLAKINLVSKREIDEHKNYFDKKTLLQMTKDRKIKAKHGYFQLGLNNLLIIKRD